MNTAEAVDKLTPENLENWLKTKQPDEFVGYEGGQCQCPIARYFIENHSVETNVGNFFDLSTFNVKGDAWTDMPDWAQDFARDVDQGEASAETPDLDENGYNIFRPTAKGCLEVLASIKETI